MTTIEMLKLIKRLDSYYLERELFDEIVKIVSPIWKKLEYDNLFEKLFYFQYWSVSNEYSEIITNELINELYLLYQGKIKNDKYIDLGFWFNRDIRLALPILQVPLNFNHPISALKWMVKHSLDEQD